MRGTTELDSSTFLNFKDHRKMKTKDNLSESCMKPSMKFEVHYVKALSLTLLPVLAFVVRV